MLIDIWRPDRLSKGLPAVEKFFIDNRQSARRFEFSLPVIAQIAEIVRDNPNLIMHNIQFAETPYDCCYLEFNIEHFINTLGTRHLSSEYFGYEDRDTTTGFLIKDGFANIIVQGTLSERNTCTLTQFGYALRPDAIIPKGMYKVVYSKDNEGAIERKLKHFLGTTFTNDKFDLSLELSEKLLKYETYIDFSFASIISQRQDAERAISHLFMGSMGELRSLLSLLFWLNQPALVEKVYAPATRRMIKNRPTAIAEHHVIKIKPGVTRKVIERTIAPRGGYRVRRHEVECFWRNYNRNDICEHEWPMEPNIRGHYHCKKCTQFRVRVNQHERGSAELGYVTKDYSV
jgi:hypothetical protein